MDKKLYVAGSIVGYILSTMIFSAINKKREKKERKEMIEIQKKTVDAVFPQSWDHY